MRAKRLLCSILAVVMILGMMSFPAFAEEETSEGEAVIALKNYTTNEIETYESIEQAMNIVANDTDGTYNPHVRISGNVVIDSDTVLPTRVVEYEDDWGEMQTETKGGLYISGDCTLTVNEGVTLTALNIWVGDDVDFTINGGGTVDANIWTDYNGVGSLTVENVAIIGDYFEVYTYNGTTLNNCSIVSAYLDTDGAINVSGVTSTGNLFVRGSTVNVNGCTMHNGFDSIGATTVKDSVLEKGLLSLQGKSADITGLTIESIDSGFTMTAGEVTPSEFNITGKTFNTCKISSPVKVVFEDCELKGTYTYPIEVFGTADVTVNNGIIGGNGNRGASCKGNAKLTLNCTIDIGIESSSTNGLTVIGGKFKANTYNTKNKLETLELFLPEGYIAVPGEESSYYDILQSSGEEYSFSIDDTDKIEVSADKNEGTYIDGTYITVTAADNNYYAFDGWYIGGEKVSDEKTYKFVLRENTVISAGVKNLAAYTPFEPEGNVYEVKTPEQLNYISYLSNTEGKSFANEIVRIVNDIDMTGVSFCPIGLSTSFKGRLIGEKTVLTRDDNTSHNVVISNLTIDPYSKYQNCGLVGKTSGPAVIQNITLDNPSVVSYFPGNSFVGAIVGEGTGATIDNCEVIDGEISGQFAGGIVGHSNGGTLVQNCNVDGTSMDSSWKSGGVVGYYEGKMTIKDTVVANYKSVGFAPSGAVAGHSNGTITMENVTVANPTDKDGNKLSLVVTDYSVGEVIIITGEETSLDISEILYSDPNPNVVIEAGKFTCDIPDGFIAENKLILKDDEGNSVVLDKDAPLEEKYLAESVSVRFVPTEDSHVYDIAIVGDDVKAINRLMSSELKFELKTGEGNIAYEIKGNGHSVVTSADEANGIYAFNFDGAEDAASLSGKEVVIGSVSFEGYGKAKFNAVTYEKAKVNTAEVNDNIVHTFVPDGSMENGFGKLNFPEENELDLLFEVATAELKVVVAFNNAITDNEATYQAMKATISGGDLTDNIVIDFGSDNDDVTFDGKAYTFTQELTENTAYTVTVWGEGYRTARYMVTMTEDKTLNFWNNVMDKAVEVEKGKEISAKNVTFLAGDIVKDNNINIYDLSAVVSYFGTENLVDEHPEYARYDLNRDGKIDSKDVAYVLVSWGK